MSKNVFRGNTSVLGFVDTLQPVIGMAKSERKSGSARIHSGLQAMFENAKEEGYKAGREAGYADGIEEGRRQGLEEFEAQHQAVLAEFRTAMESFVVNSQGAIGEWYARTEESLTTLAVEIARRAICRELEASRESVVDIAKEALLEVRHGSEVVVRVNPFDVGILEARKQEIIAALAGVRNLEVVADPNTVSGCVIETTGGVVDARVETYLLRVSKEAA